MEINSILDVEPERASDIQYFWDETDMTSEQIASLFSTPLTIVWDILGGAYEYENHQN